MLPNSAFASVEEYTAYLRDWFAGQSVNALLKAAIDGDLDTDGTEAHGQMVARNAYELADYMLAERAKRAQA